MATVLVTAGPTHEYVDDVRYLANASSGRMGYAIAAAAAARGHRALLVSGPTYLEVPDGVERIQVVSAREMRDRAVAAFGECDVAFGVAAVADYRPARRSRGKPPKTDGPSALGLVPNPDVVAALAHDKGDRIVVGFALESEHPDGLDGAVARGRAKLERKGLDLIAVNLPAALGRDESQVVVLDRDGGREDLPLQSKAATAERLLDRALALAAGPPAGGSS